MDAAVPETKRIDADGEIVWSCPPDAGVKLVDFFHERRWLSSPDTGESTYKP